MFELTELIEKAWARRKSGVGSLDMFRVFDGAADGLQNLYIDTIGSFCLAHVLEQGAQAEKIHEALVRAAPLLCKALSVEAFYERVHSKDPKSTDSTAAQLLCGTAVPEAIVREHGIRYIVRPEANVNAGIFLDTRDLRAKLKAESKDAKVLNTFCFTGSLGIAAFAGGAREVVQLDSSKAILGWARENFELNKDLGSGAMRFICEDCLTFMGREARRIEEGAQPYGVVILDPPSFGKAGSKVFSLRKNLPQLLDLACQVLAPEGKLSITTNSRGMLESDFSETCLTTIKAAGFKVCGQTPIRAPLLDFPAQEEASISTKGIFMTVKMASS